MRVGDEDGVDVAGGEAGLLQAMGDRVPGPRIGEAGIDDGDAIVVDHRVHVDVAQTRDADRELHAQDVLRDFGDLVARVFLLLAFRSRGLVAHDAAL
jgi:hypothetical protein